MFTYRSSGRTNMCPSVWCQSLCPSTLSYTSPENFWEAGGIGHKRQKIMVSWRVIAGWEGRFPAATVKHFGGIWAFLERHRADGSVLRKQGTLVVVLVGTTCRETGKSEINVPTAGGMQLVLLHRFCSTRGRLSWWHHHCSDRRKQKKKMTEDGCQKIDSSNESPHRQGSRGDSDFMTLNIRALKCQSNSIIQLYE